MRCESCESEVAEVKSVPRDNLSGAAANGFGPWGNSGPSVEWPRFVRAGWWTGATAGGADATLCASCDSMLASFEPTVHEHEWLADVDASMAAAGLRTPDMPPIDSSPELDVLTQQLAIALANLPGGMSDAASLKDGFSEHGEKYALAAATILLTADDLMLRFRSAALLGAWDDPRATAYLLAAIARNRGALMWVSRPLTARRDRNALPAAAGLMKDVLRVEHQYTPNTAAPFLRETADADREAVAKKYPGITPDDASSLRGAGLAIVSLLPLISELGGRDIGRPAMHEIYAHSLYVNDVLIAVGELLRFEHPDDDDLLALLVAAQVSQPEPDVAFMRVLPILSAHQSPAGWWAMNRCRRTSKHWASLLDSQIAMMRKPPAETLRKLERRYGRLIDLARKERASIKSGCFIATAAYGSADHAEVARLRAFRDDVLRRTRSGRAAIRIYERLSPPIANVVARSESCRAVVRVMIQTIARSRRAL